MNTFGQTLTLTTFGESHGPAIGGIIDGLPSGIAVDRQLVGVFMARRRPGGSELVSGRAEQDRVEILSGVSDDGRSLGTPIGFIIPNTDSRPRDYDALKDVFRPNHADFTYQMKYGLRDHRGG
ncbi:MAG: chorismate synthase, partial [Muribaculaceae bacterium]|nr:chorismate synthase [Muribaculaceae bacterium]